MPVVRTIACTACGAPLELRDARAKTVVCGHCAAQLDLASADYAVLESLRADGRVHPLRVGLSGMLRGVAWEIVAHVRYDEGTWWWDEYLLLAADGRTAWLQYEERAFSLWIPWVPKDPSPVDASSVALEADGERHAVTERGTATIGTIEGELTWRARVGDAMTYLDARAAGVEITSREIEWFRRQDVSTGAIAKAFGIPLPELHSRMVVPPDDEDDDDDDADDGLAYSGSGTPKAGAGTWVVIALVVVGGLVLTLASEGGCDDDDDYDLGGGGHFSGGGYGGGK